MARTDKQTGKNKAPRGYRDGITRQSVPKMPKGWALKGLFAYSLLPSVIARGLDDTEAFEDAEYGVSHDYDSTFFMYGCRACGAERLILRQISIYGEIAMFGYMSPAADVWIGCPVPYAIFVAQPKGSGTIIDARTVHGCQDCREQAAACSA